MQLQVGVKIFLNNNNGQFLFLKRAKPYPGDKKCKWDIPGGRINVQEKLLDGLRRELMEETSMKLVGQPSMIFAQDIFQGSERHVVRITFLGQANGKIILDPVEHQEYEWMTLEDATKAYHDIYLTPVIELLNQKAAF